MSGMARSTVLVFTAGVSRLHFAKSKLTQLSRKKGSTVEFVSDVSTLRRHLGSVHSVSLFIFDPL